MRLSCALLLLAVLASVFHGGQCRNPGLKAKVTEFGLTYGMKVFLSVLKDRAQQIKVPDQSGKADVVIGKVNYEFKNIQMTSFNIGGTSLPVVPNVGLRLRADGVSASLRGDWHYKAKVAFIPISDGGTLSLSISGVSLDVVIRLGKDPNDRPTISVGSCSAHIGDVSVQFHGGASWLYNLFKGAIENKIKNQLDSEICKSVSKAIDEDVEKSFAGIRVLEPVGKFADLDLGLIDAPHFQTDFMELLLKGDVVPRDSRITVPVSPGPIPELAETSHMIYLYGSEYVGNAIANIYHKAGQLRHVLKPKDIPKDLPFKLNTTYLATLVPKVGTLYPDMGIELVLNTSLPPHLSILPGHAVLTAYGNVHVYALPPGKTPTYLFSINVTMDLGAEAKLMGELLYGNVSMDPNKIKITTFGSTIGPVPPFGLDFAIRTLCKATVPWINTFALDRRFEGMLTVWTSRDFCRRGAVPAIHYLAQGIPFHLKNVLFENAQVNMHQGFISIGTDLRYTGEF